jgi:hypothetical protein
MKQVLSIVAAAGLAGAASAQLTNETSWRFDGTANWASKVAGSGPAKLYRKDDPKFATPAGTVVPASGGPNGRAEHAPDGATDAADSFGTCSSFGLPLLGGVNRAVYRTAGTSFNGQHDRGMGIAFWTADNIAGPDTSVWTFGWDLLIPTSIVGPAAIPLHNDTERDANDADAWLIVNADNTVSFHYRSGGSPVALGVSTGQWFRLVMNRPANGTTSIYVNGQGVGTSSSDTLWDRVDASNIPPALAPYWDGWGGEVNLWFNPSSLAGCTWFGDNDGVNGRSGEPYSSAGVYLANAFFSLGTVCDAAIAAWGGPSAAGFPVNNGSICSSPPGINLSAAPLFTRAGGTVTFLATVTPGAGPASTTLAVTADLSALGGTAADALFDDGTHGDQTAGDRVFSRAFTVSDQTAPAVYTVNATVTDNLGRTGTDGFDLGVESATVGQNGTQWDFNDPTNAETKLHPTFGPGVMRFWDRPEVGLPGSTEADTQFGTCSSFGIPAIGGSDAGVMKVPQYFGDQGIYVDDNMPGNGGGLWVNQFTMVFDIYVDPASLQNAPATTDGWWFPFFNTNNTNTNDADAYIYLTDGSNAYQGQLGTSAIGGYSASNAFTAGAWHRVAWAIDCARNASPSAVVYVDGNPVFTSTFSDFDGRLPLYSLTDDQPDNSGVFFFTEPTGNYTAEAYINSMYIVDHTMTGAEIAALGGANAGGIFLPGCRADFNGDDFLDFFDYLDYVTCFETAACPPGKTADYNGDDFVDFFDYADFVDAFEAGC